MQEASQTTDIPLQGKELRERAHLLTDQFRIALSNCPEFKDALASSYFGIAWNRPNPQEPRTVRFAKNGRFYDVTFAFAKNSHELTITRTSGILTSPLWPVASDKIIIKRDSSGRDDTPEPEITYTSDRVDNVDDTATNNQRAIDKALEFLTDLS